MHTSSIGTFTIHHNGDFSGEVIISGPHVHVAEDPVGDPPQHLVHLPFSLLEELVGQAKVTVLINKLEMMSGKEFLDGAGTPE